MKDHQSSQSFFAKKPLTDLPAKAVDVQALVKMANNQPEPIKPKAKAPVIAQPPVAKNTQSVLPKMTQKYGITPQPRQQPPAKVERHFTAKQMAELADIDQENFFKTPTPVIPLIPKVKKRKRQQRRDSSCSDEIDEESEKRFKYTSFVQANTSIKTPDYSRPLSSSSSRSTVIDPNSFVGRYKMAIEAYTKGTEQAYCLFKLKSQTNMKGSIFFHGKLVDLQTSRHKDKNVFKDVLERRPAIKCVVVGNSAKRFDEGALLVAQDPILPCVVSAECEQLVVASRLTLFENSWLK